VRTAGELPRLRGVAQVWPHNEAHKLALAPGTTPQDVLEQLVAQRVPLERFEVAVPTLDEIFIRTVSADQPGEEVERV